MASMFARSARRKDEDDLRKDHKKREIPSPGDQFAKRRDNTIAGALEVNEEMRALKTKPGKGVQSKDIELPDPLKGKPVGKLLPGEKSKDPLKQSHLDRTEKSPKTGAMKDFRERSRTIFGGDADDPRWKEMERERKKKK